MAFELIDNQPVRFAPFPERSYNCDGYEFCTLYKKTDDKITVQIKQTPCGDNLVLEGSFTDSGYFSVWGYDSNQWVVTVDPDGGKITHIPGSGTDILNQEILTFSASGYYVIYYTIANMTAGQITVSLGSDVSRVVSENGIYVDYVDSSASDQFIAFDVSNEFDGSISAVSCYELVDSFTGVCSLVDINGSIIASPNLTEYADDRVNFEFTTSGLTEGCYRLQLIDSCFDYFAIINNTQLLIDTGFDNALDWTASVGSAGGTSTVAASKFTFSTPGAGAGSRFGRVEQLFDAGPPADGSYIMLTEIQTGSFQSGATASCQIVAGTANSGSSTGNLFQLYNPVANTTYTQTKIITIDSLIDPQDSTMLSINTPNDTTAGHLNEIKYFSVKFIPVLTAATDYGYLSNCLRVQTNVGDALLLQGQTQLDIDSVHEYSNGFLFTPVFNRLQMRLFLSFTNPHYPKKNEVYLYSNGVKKKTYAQKSKQYDLIVYEVDENAHDCISTIMEMEYVYIGESNTVKKRYICEDTNYSPDWNKGESNTAEALIEISRIDSTIFK